LPSRFFPLPGRHFYHFSRFKHGGLHRLPLPPFESPHIPASEDAPQLRNFEKAATISLTSPMLTAMFENFLNPVSLHDYSDYFKTLLSISGVLLGLTFTALLFVLQSGFTSFKFSRRMFLEQYVAFGNNLLTSLSYLTLMPLGILYLGGERILLSCFYCAFGVVFIKTFLDLYRQRGYIHTLTSNAFVPEGYGKFRAYFRYIRNLGWHHVFFIILWLSLFWVYPVAISYHEVGALLLTDKGYFYSTLLILTFAVLQITFFIPQFFMLSNLEFEHRIPSEDEDTNGGLPGVDYNKERAALRTYLLDHGISELNNEVEFLDGTLFLNFEEERKGHEAWFHVNIEVRNSGVIEIRNAVLDYAYKVFGLLSGALVDINSFVLSFHIRAGGERFTRNMFFRVTRPELREMMSGAKPPRLAVLHLKNKIIDELYRDLD
jgi:hypothetical protein